jgi:hypothetical protein
MKNKIFIIVTLMVFLSVTVFSQAIIYSTYIGGSEEDIPDNMAIDENEAIYISGTTKSVIFPVTSGVYDITFNGGVSDLIGKEDIYLLKYSTQNNTIEYCTYLGGAQGPDFAWSMKTDKLGNVYLGGNTGASDFPVTSGAYNTIYSGTGDRHEMGFLTKMNDDGSQLVFSTFFPNVADFELDDEGCIYIIGQVNEEEEVTNDAFDSSFNGGNDLYIAKLNSNATKLEYATYIGGSGNESASECLYLDKDLNLYFAGATSSIDFPFTNNAFDTTYNGKSNSLGDGFVGKFNLKENKLEFLTYIGGSKDDEVTGLKVFNDKIYIAGRTVSIDFPVSESAYDTTFNGGTFDFFIATFSSVTGELMASTYIGGSKYENQRNIAVDNEGNVILTGNTNSTDFPTTPNAYNTNYNGGSTEQYWMGDIVLLKMNPELSNLIYSSYIGGSDDEHSAQVICDPEGRIILAGATKSSNFPIAGNAIDNTINGDRDIFLLKFDTETTAIKSNNRDKKMAIFPNPTSGQFSISFGSNPVEEARVTIFNLQGTQVFSKTFYNTPSATIDLTGNSAGIYMVKLKSEGVLYINKICLK